MMNKTKLISLVAISLFLFSCSSTSKEKTGTAVEAHDHDNLNEPIELNNGDKWKVDSNMILPIRQMENDITSFVKGEHKDYKSLANKLQTNIDVLTSNCTMKGKAHDELHKWLLPYIELVKELSESKDETKAAKQLEIIQTSFRTFNQYFQ